MCAGKHIWPNFAPFGFIGLKIQKPRPVVSTSYFYHERPSRLLKNASCSFSRSSLWFSVRSLCLCGECFCSHFHHRVTENHRESHREIVCPDRADGFFSSLLALNFSNSVKVLGHQALVRGVSCGHRLFPSPLLPVTLSTPRSAALDLRGRYGNQDHKDHRIHGSLQAEIHQAMDRHSEQPDQGTGTRGTTKRISRA